MLLVISCIDSALDSRDKVTIVDTDDFVTEDVFFEDIEGLISSGKLHIENINTMTNLPIKNQYFVRPYSMIEDGINTFGDELIVVDDYKLLIWYDDTLFFFSHTTKVLDLLQ